MKHGSALLLCLWLAACAGPAIAPRAEHLFADALFAPPSEEIRAEDVFAVSAAMQHHLDAELAPQVRSLGVRRGLIDALYSRGRLRIDYDSTMTRNAAQAFDAKAGNCLSLVIMTAAFAKQLGLPVRYQNVFVDEAWSRVGGIYFASGHVNLTLGARMDDARRIGERAQLLTVDFLPAQDIAGRRTREISESTVVAMYMNNRSAEALAQGRLDDAYWWARHAITHRPTHLNSYNTLGVVYLRHGDLALAQRTLEQALEHEPDNTRVLSNLARVLTLAGRPDEARAVGARLAAIEPYPPFHFFDLGVAAMRAGDYQGARALFAKEVARDADYHEFHFWLALAHAGLGELPQARKQLGLAMEASTTRKDREIYAAKLDRIRATVAQ